MAIALAIALCAAGAAHAQAMPLTLGGNLNFTPGYETRLSEDQTALVGDKLVFDAYALWTVKPGMALRLSATNLAARDYTTAAASTSSRHLAPPRARPRARWPPPARSGSCGWS